MIEKPNFQFKKVERQNQNQSLAPEIIKALQILELPSIELAKLIHETVLENPIIDFVDDSFDCVSINEMDRDLLVSSSGKNRENRDRGWIDNIGQSEETLRDHLLTQLGYEKTTPQERLLGEYIIDSINDKGYLIIDPNDYGPLFESMLKKIQAMDPPGVGAGSLAECLILQLRRKGINDAETEYLINNYLEEIEYDNYKKITSNTEISKNRIIKVKALIKSLNPYPGNGFYKDKTDYIYPDVIIEKKDGRLSISLGSLNQVNIYRDEEMYRSYSESTDESVREYINEKNREFLWLKKAIEKRQSNIINVTEAIIKRQPDYFIEGSDCLKPMTMKDIASDLEQSISTVSRTCSGKYMLTSDGLISFKTFFSSGIVSGEDQYSANGVKNIIKKIIREEEKTHPYTDIGLVEKLKEYNIDISRRTVTKYRSQLKIAPCAQRKR